MIKSSTRESALKFIKFHTLHLVNKSVINIPLNSLMQLHKQQPQCGRQTALLCRRASEIARSRRPRAYIWQTLCALFAPCMYMCVCGAAYLTSWAAQGGALFASRAMIVTIYGRLAAGQLFIFCLSIARQVDQKEL